MDLSSVRLNIGFLNISLNAFASEVCWKIIIIKKNIQDEHHLNTWISSHPRVDAPNVHLRVWKMWENSILKLLKHLSCGGKKKNHILLDMFHNNQSKIQSGADFLAVIRRNTKIHLSTSDGNPMSHSSVQVTLSEIQNRMHTGQNCDNMRGETREWLQCFLYSLPRLAGLMPLFKLEFKKKRNCNHQLSSQLGSQCHYMTPFFRKWSKRRARNL